MPMQKINDISTSSAMEEKKDCCGEGKGGCMSGGCCGPSKCCHGFGKKILMTLVGILLVYAVVFLGTLIRNNIQKYYFIGKADRNERTISVAGQGKITVKPDIAVVNMGMTAEATTVAEAQQKNTEIMNKLLAKVKGLGIDEKDLQTTNYNIYPQYNWTEAQGQVLKGYQVSQNVTIKIRDLQKAQPVLSLAGEVGANSVGGLQFTIDDKEVYKAQARQLALKQVEEKTKALKQSLGVQMVSIVSYDEYENNDYPLSYYSANREAVGMGGGAAPDIQPGTNDIVMNVSVTFEIR